MKGRVKKLLGLALVWATLFASAGSITQIQAQANDTDMLTTADTNAVSVPSDIQDGLTLHCWNWSYRNIEANMARIAELGFTAVQTSPIQQAKEGTNGKTVGGNWWVYYQPAAFTIDNTGNSALGTKSDFESMCRTAHSYGVKVIVDVVANHMGNKTGNNLADTIIPDLKNDSSCWHDISKNIGSYDSRYEITQRCLDGLPDLNTSNRKVQNYVLNYLKECIDAGVDGFRFDTAKHIEVPEDSASGCGSDFWPYVINGATDYASSSRGIDLYCYGEVLDKTVNNGSVPISAYTKYMSVTDNEYSNTLRGHIAGGNAAGAGAPGYWKDAAADKLVLWAESHDTYASNSSSGVSVHDINKTWALAAARTDAMGLYLARPNSTGTQLGAADVTGWSYSEVGAVNKFHNAFVGQKEYMASEDGVAYCERGTTGVVLVNCNGNERDVNVTAHMMQNGTYKDQVSGNTFTVENGRISGRIGDKGFAVVYTASHTPIGQDNTAYIQQPEGWSGTLYCYVYSADNEKNNNGAWPGAVMTKVSDGVYKYEVPSTISNPLVIFSDGTNQYPGAMETGLALSGNMIYRDGSWEKYDEVSTGENIAYITKDASWGSTLYCYAYSESDESNNNGAWPGVKMTQVSGNLYKYEVPSSITDPLVIFTDGVNQYPGALEKGLALSGSMIYEGGSWGSYQE